MTKGPNWVGRVLQLVVWALVAACVAFFVARSVADVDSGVDVTESLPPVTVDQRALTSLSETSIVPVVSADGSVVEGESGWFLEAVAPTDELAYELLDPPLGVKAAINGGPSGFDCAWAGLGKADQTGIVAESAKGLAPSTTGVTMRCVIPDDVRVVAGMRGVMVLRMGEPSDVSALPVSSVVGDAKFGQVVVVREDESLELRDVSLGVSDIYNIEIQAGLTAEEQVLLNPTQADFAQAQSQS